MPEKEALSNRPSIFLIGFGEAGQAFASGWKAAESTAPIAAFDIKTNAAGSIAAAKWSDYDAAGVRGVASLAEVPEDCAAVFSLVTADQAEAAAVSAAEDLAPGSLFFDCNSCSPGTKRRNATVLEAKGIRYVDTAVMAPVHPRLHRTPLLISGPHTPQALALLDELEMVAKLAGPEVGTASATKMVRSVMIKGIEALTLECLLAGRRAGVDGAVLASLDASMPGWNWSERAGYNMERATTHGIRRAAEMREVARTVEELGLPADMSRAIVEWQQRAGELGLDLGSGETDVFASADLINKALTSRTKAAE